MAGTASRGVVVTSSERYAVSSLSRYAARTATTVTVAIARTNSLLHRSLGDAGAVAAVGTVLVATAAVPPTALVDVGVAGVVVELWLMWWRRRRRWSQVTLGGGITLLIWR